MKVLGFLMLMGGLLIVMVVPSYFLINFYNQRMGSHYQVPRFKSVVISLTLALVVSGFMSVDFEGAVFTGLASVFILHCVILLLGIGGFTLVRYFGRSA